MGGAIDDGFGICKSTSSNRTEMAKTQADLRQEYNFHETRRRELEFLEEGGNPLDFQRCPATSIGFQPTSLKDQLVTSEAISSGSPDALPWSNRNNAGNHLLSNDDKIMPERGKYFIYPSSSTTPSEQPSVLDGNHNEKESNGSANVRLTKKIQPYTRRNRSRSSHVSIKPLSTDSCSVGEVNGSLSSSNRSRITEHLCKTNTLKDHSVSCISTGETTCPNGNEGGRSLPSTTELDMKLNAVQAEGTAGDSKEVSLLNTDCNITHPESLQSHTEGSSQLPRVQSEQDPNISDSSATDIVRKREIGALSSHHNYRPGPATEHVKNHYIGQNSGLTPPGNKKAIAAITTKGSGSESSFNKLCRQSHENNARVDYACSRKPNSSVYTKEQTLLSEGTPELDVNLFKENSGMKVVDIVTNDGSFSCQNLSKSGSWDKVEDQAKKRSGTENKVITCTFDGKIRCNDRISLTRKGNSNDQCGDNAEFKMPGSCYQRIFSAIVNSSNYELPGNTPSKGNSTTAPMSQTSWRDNLKLVNRAHEESVLKEAKIIEENYKRNSELLVRNFSLDKRKKSHWDYLLEEMAWLANDFMQERVWKLTAAAQVCHRVSSVARCRFDEQDLCRKQRKVANIMSKAIMQFWRSAEETSKHLEDQCSSRKLRCTVHEYATRFLKYNSSLRLLIQRETSLTPNKITNMGDAETPREVQSFEESLFFTIPPGAMEQYRKLVESELPEDERTGKNMHQDEVETFAHDTNAEFRTLGNAFEENGQQTSRHSKTKIFDVRKKSSRSSLNGQKSIPNSSMIMGKRPCNILGLGSIPTNVRTASRKRVRCLFVGGASGGGQVENIDVSSVDSSSVQDKLDTVHDELQPRKTLYVKSKRDLVELFPTNYTQISTTPKRAKSKHLEFAYEKRWQCDPMMPKEQMPAEQSRSTWLPSEDQALLDVVHDLGLNWDLVSDAINSTILFKVNKYKFRKPKECEERYQVLLEKDTGDGAGSGEGYPGSSQPYPLPLPSIPRDSAGNMSRCLGSMIEVDTLRSRFQKIILIGKQQHALRIQNNFRDLKQILQVHSSHVLSFSRVSANGGPLTPLDLCDPTTSGPDVISPSYEGCHTSGLEHSVKVSIVPVLPDSSDNSMLQGSSGNNTSNSLPTVSPALTASTRCSQRSDLARPPSLLISEQQKLQHLTRVLSMNKTQQSSLSARGTLPISDRSVQVLPGGSGMSIIQGMNRSRPMSKPALQGMGLLAMNMSLSGSMLSPSRVRMPSTVSMHTGATSGQENSSVRPPEALDTMRLQNSADQRQMTSRVQFTQGSSKGILSFSDLRIGASNQMGFSTFQKEPAQQQQKPHETSQQSQELSKTDLSHLPGSNYATDLQGHTMPRLAKERIVSSSQMGSSTFQKAPAQQQQKQQHEMSQQLSKPEHSHHQGSNHSNGSQQNAMPRLEESQLRKQVLKRNHHRHYDHCQQQKLSNHVAVFNSSRLNTQSGQQQTSPQSVMTCNSQQPELSRKVPISSEPHKKQQKLLPRKQCSKSSSIGPQAPGLDGEAVAAAAQASSTARQNNPKQRQHLKLVKEMSRQDTTGQNPADSPFHGINYSIAPGDPVAAKSRRSMHPRHNQPN